MRIAGNIKTEINSCAGALINHVINSGTIISPNPNRDRPNQIEYPAPLQNWLSFS